MDEVRGPSTSTERSRKRRELIKSNPDKFNEYKAMQSQKKKVHFDAAWWLVKLVRNTY